MVNCKVRYSRGCTLNMGNYESERVDISLEREVEDSKKVIEDCYSKLESWVEDKLQAKVDELSNSDDEDDD